MSTDQNLKPYSRYKDSGEPWLGKVPEHWEMRKLRTLLENINERDRSDLPMLSVVREQGVIKRDISSKDENHNYIPDDLSNYKVVRSGQFAMNKMKAWQGSYGVSKYDGIVSPAYYVFKLTGIRGDFFHVAIRSKVYIAFFAQASDGIRIGQWDLSQVRMKEIPFFVPSLDEQTAIVRFLDYTDRRIKRYIRAKQKLIKLLNEEKQVIIQQAVTRGLDPNVRLKPSGVEWLGNIPEHWQEVPAKSFYKEIDIRSSTGTEELLSVSHITGVTPRSQKNITMFMASSYIGHKLCQPGDLVINTMWAWMGALGVSKQTGIVSPSYNVYRSIQTNNFVPEFIDLLLRTKTYISEFICRSVGIRSSRLRLYPEQFLKIPIPKPPYSEQEEIIRYVNQKTKKLEQAISSYQSEVNLVKEYHTRLIADVVTGKLDVREAAAWLPADLEAIEPVEDEEILTEDTETPEEAEADGEAE